MAQVEYILKNEQKPEDYNPPGDMITDLKPTKVMQSPLTCVTPR